MTMNIPKINYSELIIFILSVVGTFCVASITMNIQLVGFFCWIISNFISIIFFYKKKLYFLTIQFVIFLIIAIKAIYVRLLV